MSLEREALNGPLAALIDRGEERGCVDLSEVDELAQALELEDEDLGALYEQLHARHIELRDDCTRQDAPEAPLDDAQFATVTTDTLQLFLNEIGRHRLLTPTEEIDLAKRIERGDLLPSEGPAPEDVVHVSLREEMLRRALDELPERERTVVAMRYGIDGGEPTPLREIGRQLGITPERVRQIESKALGRLGRMRELAALRQAA